MCAASLFVTSRGYLSIQQEDPEVLCIVTLKFPYRLTFHAGLYRKGHNPSKHALTLRSSSWSAVFGSRHSIPYLQQKVDEVRFLLPFQEVIAHESHDGWQNNHKERNKQSNIRCLNHQSHTGLNSFLRSCQLAL